MSKKKSPVPPPPITAEPPLHVELSAPAQAAFNRIRAARGWNKKTATESCIMFFYLNGDRLDLSRGGKK